MNNKSEIEESKAFATGLFQGTQIVSYYMKDCHPLIEGVIIKSETGHREACLKGLWMRAYAWMQTIGKLNDPLDFQAISAGNRALLEITVDLVLLHHDKTNESGWKMFWWNLSEKLKASEQIISFYNEQGLTVPDTYEAQEIFCRDEKSIIDNMRVTLWPNKKNPSKPVHPDRWTGNGNLFDDIVKADQLYGSVIKADIGLTLVEYYRTEYRKMNWRIHSGVASFWNQPPEAYNLTCGFALKWCADFGMLCTKIILNDFGFDVAVEGLKQEWESIKSQRDLVCFQELDKFHRGVRSETTKA
jgi:hypothetical protein